MRPTRDNVTALKRELKQPRFQSYHYCECRLPSSATVRLLCKGLDPTQHTARSCVCAQFVQIQAATAISHVLGGEAGTVLVVLLATFPPRWSLFCVWRLIVCAVPCCAVRCADFSNLVSQMHLQDLAEADAAQEQVQAVQEFYADFMALDKHHFMVPVPCNDVLINPRAAAALGGSE